MRVVRPFDVLGWSGGFCSNGGEIGCEVSIVR